MSEVMDLCKNLVRFPSYNGNTAEIMNFLQDYLEQNAFSVRLLSFDDINGNKVVNLCASYGKGHPHLLFVGHADVVPAGEESKWKYPPFAAVENGGILYGRGIADMKGGLACFIQACIDAIKDNDFSGKITIIVSGDEENPIVEGANKVLQKLEEEGEKFDFALVGEPSNPISMGDEIKIGRRGDMVFHISSYGQLGHTAYADKSSNPVYNLINLLYTLQNDTLDKGNKYFGPSTVHVTTFDVGNNASNVVPGKATATIDVRFNSEQNYASIEAWLGKHMQNIKGRFDIRVEYIGESFLSNLDKNVVDLSGIIKKYTGKEPDYSTAGGTSDARFVRKYCPVVEYGLTNGTIHKVNECERVENIEMLYHIYGDFIEHFFK